MRSIPLALAALLALAAPAKGQFRPGPLQESDLSAITVPIQQQDVIVPNANTPNVGIVPSSSGLDFGHLSVSTIGGSSAQPMLGIGSVTVLPAGVTLSGGGHQVGGLCWGQAAGTSPLLIGCEGKIDILSTANVLLAIAGQSQVNQAQAGATVGALYGHNVALNNVAANLPLFVAYPLTLNNSPAAGSTITFMAMDAPIAPAAIAGNVGTFVTHWQPDWSNVPGIANIGTRDYILNQDPHAAIVSAGPTTLLGETTVPTPVNPTDAATKAYVDAHAGGGSYTLPGATASALGGLQLAPGQTSTTLAKVASTGAYGDLSGLPALGGAAALSVGTTAGTVAAGNDSRLINAILSGSAASVSSLTSSGAITGASVTSLGPLSATYFSSPNNAYTLTTQPARLNLIQNTLNLPATTSAIWENFDSFLYLNGPGQDNGEINLNHTYFENELNAIANGGVEGYESSQINNGQEPAGFASFLSVQTNAATGTVTGGTLFGLNTQLTNNNTAAGAVGSWVPLNCNAMLGPGSHPSYEYCIRNANAQGMIASLGPITLGNLAGCSGGLLCVTGPDASGGTFPVAMRNSAGLVLLLIADDGSFHTSGSIGLGDFAGSNGIVVAPHAAGGAPTITATGSDANIGINLVAKGSGVLALNGVSGVTCTGSPTSSFASAGGIVTHC